jgi:hypothetical protein
MRMNHVIPMRAATASMHDVPQAGLPLVLVVEPVPGLSMVLEELCEFLRIRVAVVSEIADLGEALASQPIAVLVRAPAGAIDPRMGRALHAVARHDATMPVMLVTDASGVSDPSVGLTNLHWMAGPPSLKPLVEFLFLAERRGGVAGLMPLDRDAV